MGARAFFDLAQAARNFQESRVLLTAVELDLFSAVGGGATAAQAARRMRTDARATETLLNALVSLGALEKRGKHFHNTTETAAHLAGKDSERMALMHSANLWKSWSALTQVVKTGKVPRTPSRTAGDREWTKSFIAAMHSRARGTAREFVRVVGADGVRRLLDVGGGSAAFSIEFARANPDLRADVLDLTPVLSIARRHIREAGLSSRIATRAGDLTSDALGQGYDLILLSAICHMLGPGENLDLFRRCRRALVPGGRLAIREFILDEDKTGPRMAALFAINMLVGTRNGSSYSLGEYSRWLHRAGFTQVVRPDPAGDVIIAAR